MKNTTIKKGIYQHYKGHFYEVIELATHTESLDPLVVYRSLYGDYTFWARPLSMFLESVEINGKHVPRFKHIDKLQSKQNNQLSSIFSEHLLSLN